MAVARRLTLYRPASTLILSLLLLSVATGSGSVSGYVRSISPSRPGDLPQVSAGSVPGVPLNLSGKPGSTSINLTWKPPASKGSSNETGYTIVWLPAEQTSGSRRVGNVTSTVIGGLTTNISYNFSIAAWNDVGEGNFSAPVEVSTGALPSPPNFLVVKPGNENLTITWLPASTSPRFPILEYVLNVTPENQSSVFYQNAVSPTYLSGLTNGVRYYVSVRAMNEIGFGKPCPVEGSTPAEPPSPPVGYKALFESSNDTLTVSWSEPVSDGGSNITGYELYWTSTSGVVGRTFVAPTLSRYSIPSASFGSTYTISISAMNGVGSGQNVTFAATIPQQSTPGGPLSTYLVPLEFLGIMLVTLFILVGLGRLVRSSHRQG